MSSLILETQVVEALRQMPSEDQRRVLDYARSLARAGASGIPGAALLPFAEVFSPEDVKEMETAIHEDCERINPNDR